MSFELIYKEIGDIGRYQIYVLLLGWACGIHGGLIWINSVFLLYVPEHRYVRIYPYILYSSSAIRRCIIVAYLVTRCNHVNAEDIFDDIIIFLF